MAVLNRSTEATILRWPARDTHRIAEHTEHVEIVLHAIVFADKAIEENNGKKGLIGIFQSFNFTRFPTVAPTWYVYVAFGNVANGRHDVTVNVIHDDTGSVIVRSHGEVQVRTSATDVEIVFPMAGAAFRAPGVHWLTVTLDQAQIGSRVLRVGQQVTDTK